jgi:cytochrome c
MKGRRVLSRWPWPAAAALAGWCAGALAADSSPERGRTLFAACAVCHTPGQGTVTGPDLKGMMGRKAGTVPGFLYSRALKNSKIVWSAETIDAFLENPQALVPGNTMPYPGMPDAAERRELIAFLQTMK